MNWYLKFHFLSLHFIVWLAKLDIFNQKLIMEDLAVLIIRLLIKSISSAFISH